MKYNLLLSILTKEDIHLRLSPLTNHLAPVICGRIGTSCAISEQRWNMSHD